MSWTIPTSQVECRECGFLVTVPDNMWNRVSSANGSFLCPNGHSIRPKAPSEIAQLKEKIAALKEEADKMQRMLTSAHETRDHALEESRHQRNVNAGLRGYIARMKRSKKAP